MNIKDVDFTKISDSDLIRILNFCETEFGYYGQYEFNNTEGLLEIINNFDMPVNEIIDNLYKNKDLNNNDDFLYFDTHLKSYNRKDLLNHLKSNEKHFCNGELQEIIKDSFNFEIEFE